MKQHIFSIKKLAVLAAVSMLSASAFAACVPKDLVYQGQSYPASVWTSKGNAPGGYGLWLGSPKGNKVGVVDKVPDLRVWGIDQQVAIICLREGYELRAYTGYNYTGWNHSYNGYYTSSPYNIATFVIPPNWSSLVLFRWK
jgi:hypothetical protein